MSAHLNQKHYTKTHVSAPGKVLISGGYQILQRPLAGLVFTTNCRFHAHCGAAPIGTVALSSLDAPWQARVFSEQLQEESFYRIQTHHTTTPLKRDVTLLSGPANPFVLHALRCALAAVGTPVLDAFLSCFLASPAAALPASDSSPLPCLLSISVQGDNAFYVQTHNLARLGLPLCPESLEKLPPFQPIARDAEGNLQKTGLGSSAALTVSVIGAVTAFLHQNERPSHWQQLIYQAAQVAHCAAQGKIGSGFDVSAAVFGSHKYVRFSPALLEPLLQRLAEGALCEPSDLLAATQWDDVREPLSFPSQLKLILADVNAGSNTPSMVRKVLDGLAHRADTTLPVWQQLTAANVAFEAQLKRFEAEKSGLEQHAARLQALGAAFEQVRVLLRRLGELCDVPIEPPEQTTLLDSTLQLPGVIFAGVPGAGGYDAVFAAVLNNEETLHRVDAHWAAYPTSVWRLAVSQDDRGILLNSQSNL